MSSSYWGENSGVFGFLLLAPLIRVLEVFITVKENEGGEKTHQLFRCGVFTRTCISAEIISRAMLGIITKDLEILFAFNFF